MAPMAGPLRQTDHMALPDGAVRHATYRHLVIRVKLPISAFQKAAEQDQMTPQDDAAPVHISPLSSTVCAAAAVKLEEEAPT